MPRSSRRRNANDGSGARRRGTLWVPVGMAAAVGLGLRERGARPPRARSSLRSATRSSPSWCSASRSSSRPIFWLVDQLGIDPEGARRVLDRVSDSAARARGRAAEQVGEPSLVGRVLGLALFVLAIWSVIRVMRRLRPEPVDIGSRDVAARRHRHARNAVVSDRRARRRGGPTGTAGGSRPPVVRRGRSRPSSGAVWARRPPGRRRNSCPKWRWRTRRARRTSTHSRAPTRTSVTDRRTSTERRFANWTSTVERSSPRSDVARRRRATASDRPIADRHPGRRDHPVLPRAGICPVTVVP